MLIKIMLELELLPWLPK